MSMKLAGNVVLFRARLIVTVPSSSGWRSTSSVRRLNSGSSSRKRTPLWLIEISPGVGVEPPPTRPGVADRMVRRAERPHGQERLARLQPAHGAVDPRGLDRFAGGQVGQDRRHPLGQHRLAGAGRAEHQQIMAAGGRHDDRPLGHLLAADVGEIDVVVGQFAKQVVQPRGGRFDLDFARQEGDGLGQALHGDDLDAFHDGRFRGAFGGHDQPAEVLVLGGGHGHRQGPFGRPRAAVQGQFADDRVLGERLGSDLSAADERAHGDRQIERGGILGQVGRGQVDDDAALRALKARVDHRPLDAMRAFLDGGLGQSDQNVFGQTAGRDIDLDLNGQGIDADEREGFEFGEHRRFVLLSRWERVGVRAMRSVTGILSSSLTAR